MTQRQTDIETPGAALAELRSAWKTFGSGEAAVHAVQSVDLQVRPGELLALLGPNGAGKTTALGMLTGLSAPTGGTARLFGRDPRDRAARQRMGVMLQSSGVPDTLRVRELLTAFRGYYPCPLPVASVVQAAGLHALENRMFGTLSGGQQRRVLFGIALCGNPDLVFADEPTTGLEAEVRPGGAWTRGGADDPLPGGGRCFGRPDRCAEPGAGDRRGHPGADQVPGVRAAHQRRLQHLGLAGFRLGRGAPRPAGRRPAGAVGQ